MYDVIIVKKDCAVVDFDPDTAGEIALTYKSCGEICPHLVIHEDLSTSCSIHEMPWFYKTPCAEHTQIGSPDSDCRMGSYLLKAENRKYRERILLIVP